MKDLGTNYKDQGHEVTRGSKHSLTTFFDFDQVLNWSFYCV